MQRRALVTGSMAFCWFPPEHCSSLIMLTGGHKVRNVRSSSHPNAAPCHHLPPTLPPIYSSPPLPFTLPILILLISIIPLPTLIQTSSAPCQSSFSVPLEPQPLKTLCHTSHRRPCQPKNTNSSHISSVFPPFLPLSLPLSRTPLCSSFTPYLNTWQPLSSGEPS